MRSKLRIVAAGGWLCLGLVAGGCATAPAPPPGSVSSPMPGRQAEPVRPQPTAGASPSAPAPVPAPSPPGGTAVGTTASGGTITQTGPAVAPGDSVPSAEAQAVLQTIPDPVSGETHTDATAPAAGAGHAGLPAQADTAAAPRDSADVPTPSLTQPLGDRPGARALTDSAAAIGPPGAAQASPGAGNGGMGASAGGAASAGNPGVAIPADSCWRVQVAAVPEPVRAASLREAAQSQLWTTMVIETEKKLHKVRTKDCLTAVAAERLKQRAIAAGFKGAFRYKPPR